MPASPGGSVVDPSLLRQAADRGVTICFADLDGADGLWVPEERTVLVSRRLSEAEVAEVIEHELTHVAIDDQHAALDAGKDVLVGAPPSARSRLLPAALTAAALVAVVGGAGLGLAKAGRGPVDEDRVVGPTTGVLPSGTGAAVPPPSTVLSPVRGSDGRVVLVTVQLTATPSLPTTSGSAGSPAPSANRSPIPTATRPTGAVPPPGGQTGTPSQSPPPATTPPPTPSPTAEPTTTAPPVEPTTPAASGVGEPGGDQGTDGIPTADGAADSSLVPGTPVQGPSN